MTERTTNQSEPVRLSKSFRAERIDKGVEVPPQTAVETDTWKPEDSAALYGVERWSNGYFGVSENGNVEVCAPSLPGCPTIEMTEIVSGLKQRGLDMPVMLRIENLLDDRITKLNTAFQDSIRHAGYKNEYRGVFPIKVNQQQHVVSEIARFGNKFDHGFEAGSKAELLIAISSLQSKDSLIICNGYKDEEFVDLGLHAIRIGYKCFFVLETFAELELIIERSKHWKIKPLLGVRLKLSTQVDGHWAGDSGDRSLFGLSTRQLINIVDTLRDEEKLDCLQLVHFHLGSQLPNIRNVRDGVHEACRYYIELVNEGVPLKYLDVGGGLAVDYDGSCSTNRNSRNYDLEEYCLDIVEAVMESLDPHKVSHPILVSESGRWTVAPMSVLMFNVLSVSDFEPMPIEDSELEASKHSEPVANLITILNSIKDRRLQENYNDAIYYRDLMRKAFRSGVISLRERAFAENVSLEILRRIAALVPTLKRPSSDLVQMRDALADIYYGNFSIFQSLPDSWAIQQVFPVMPLHRLNEKPTRNAIIADLTCDCDGKLDRFNTEQEECSTLPLHPLNAEEYYIGVFLVGSYQETLGDLHNLFGDTNVASVRIGEEGELEFMHELEGDRISDVLSYVEYQPQEMAARVRTIAESAVREGRISVVERQEFIKLFNESLRGYTYFEN